MDETINQQVATFQQKNGEEAYDSYLAGVNAALAYLGKAYDRLESQVMLTEFPANTINPEEVRLICENDPELIKQYQTGFASVVASASTEGISNAELLAAVEVVRTI